MKNNNLLLLRNHWVIFYQILYVSFQIYNHNAGHMTKMVATPIYVKNLQKSFFFLEPLDRFPCDLVRNIGNSGPSYFFHIARVSQK